MALSINYPIQQGSRKNQPLCVAESSFRYNNRLSEDTLGAAIKGWAAQRVLYSRTAVSSFSADEFLQAVCDAARQSFPPGIEIDCQADPEKLSNDVAMPLALILNELLTNAVKHGLSGRQEGSVRVRLKRENETFLLSVEDDGPGFDLESAGDKSSGLKIIRALARQLAGRFEVANRPTSRCIVQFGGQ
jgi:two-component sensor histidine kinase